MSLLEDLYGELAPTGDLEFRNGRDGLVAGRKPKGIQGLLGDISEGSDKTLEQIPALEQFLKEHGAHQSGLGWALGKLMASLAPSTVGSAARIAKAPMDYAQGRDTDLRMSDAALAFPVAGPAARALAPALRMSPEVATVAGMGTAGAAYGHGISSEANAATEGDRIAMPKRVDKQKFLDDYARFYPRPAAPGDLASVLAQAEKDATSVRGFDELGPKAQQKRIQEARQRAQAAYDMQGRNLGAQQDAWTRDAEKAWSDAQVDWDKQEKSFKDQGFWDRNPEARNYAMAAGYGLPAAFGAGSAIQRGRTMTRLAEDMASPDIAKAAAARVAANKYLNPSLADQAKKVGLTALAAGGPFEVRSIGDAMDATFAPEGSGAQTRAREHFSKPFEYIAGGVPQMLSGAFLYGAGNKAGSLLTRDAKASLAGATSPSLTEEINSLAAQRAAASDAMLGASKQQVANRGLLADLEAENAVKGIGNSARISEAQAAAEAAAAARGAGAQGSRVASGAPANTGLLDEIAAPGQTVVAPPPTQRQLPPAVPGQIPSRVNPESEWAELYQPAARKAIENHLATGMPLQALSEPQLRGMMKEMLPEGMKLPSASGLRSYLSDLKAGARAVGGIETPAQAKAYWKRFPGVFSVGGPAIATGIGSSLMNFDENR